MNKYRLEVYEEIPLNRWFSNNGDFAPTEHLAIFRDIFLIVTAGGSKYPWHLLYKVQGYW